MSSPLLRLLAMSALVLGVLSGIGARRAPAGAELHVLNWSDYIDPDLVKTFEAEHHCKVTLDVYEETEAMLAKLGALKGEAGANVYDVVVASDHAVPVLKKLGLIQDLDLAKIPNAANVERRFVKPAYDPEGNLSLPYQWGTEGILYNKKKFPQFKPSWAGLFSGSAPGKFILLDSPRDTLGAALIFLGTSPNTRDPAALKAAGKRLLAAKADPNFVGFDGSVSAAKRVLSGQADFCLVYNGDALNALKDKPDDFDYVVPTEGSIIWVDTMVLTANAQNAQLGRAFMNFILSPAAGAKLSNYINYATPNSASLEQISPAARHDKRIYPTEATIKTCQYLEDVGAATQVYDAVWTAVKAH